MDKKIKNRNMMCAQCECKKKLLIKNDNKKTRLWKIYIFKISVEQTKSNEKFYFYLYPLGV